MTLDGIVEVYLCHIQSRKSSTSHIYISGLFHETKMIQDSD